MILDEVKEEYVKDLMKREERVDGRGLLDYRDIKVEKGIIPNAEGSALANIGGTKVLAGVKLGVFEPFSDRPDEGVLMCNAEFSPLAHPDFESGPPREKCIELARVVDRGIRGAEVIDMKKMFISEGKVYAVFIDLYALDNCGNLLDAAALAAMAALKGAKKPAYDEKTEKLDYENRKDKLEIVRDVLSCSFEKIGGKLVLDATDEEEVASEGRLTTATCSDELVCGGQKSGAAAFSKDEVLQMIDLSFEKRKQLLKHL